MILLLGRVDGLAQVDQIEIHAVDRRAGQIRAA